MKPELDALMNSKCCALDYLGNQIERGCGFPCRETVSHYRRIQSELYDLYRLERSCLEAIEDQLKG